MKNIKKILKQLLIPLLAGPYVSPLARSLFKNNIPIFMLHRCVPDDSAEKGHTPSYLRQCLQFLKNSGHSFVSLENIIIAMRDGNPLPEKSVAFTMDDGFYDQATIAAPVFTEFKCPVTIFLISGMLDGDNWPWDDKIVFIVRNTDIKTIEFSIEGKKHFFNLGTSSNKTYAIRSIQNLMKSIDGYMITEILQILATKLQVIIPETAPPSFQPITWDMARDLEKQGVSFAPHTVTHRILSRLSAEESKSEIKNSWRRLQQELSSPTQVFCYPTGRISDFSKREINFLKNSDFIGAVSTLPSYVDVKNNSINYRYSLPRFGFPDSIYDLMQYCSWIEHAKNKILHR